MMYALRASVVVSAAVLSFVFFLTFSQRVSAHNLGVSLEQAVGEYFVDIGYDPDPLQAGKTARFDFELYDNSPDKHPIGFSSVWLRLERNDKTTLATGIAKAVWGPTTLLMNLPEVAGPLTLHARYEQGEDVLAETSFVLNVEHASADGFSGNAVLPAFGGFVVGGILAALILRRKRG